MKSYFSTPGMKKLMVVLLVLISIDSVVVARITVWTATIFESLNDVQVYMKYLYIVIGSLLLEVVLEYVISILHRRQVCVSFTRFINEATDKILDMDYSEFTTKGTAYINTCYGYTDPISRSGKIVTNIFKAGMNFVAIVVSICIIEGVMIIPIVIIYTIGGIIVKRCWNKISKDDDRLHKLWPARNIEIDKIIDGFAEVRENNTQQMHRGVIYGMNEEIQSILFHKFRELAKTNSVFASIDNISTLVIIMYGIIAIPNGMATGFIMSMIALFVRLTGPLDILLDSLGDLSDAIQKHSKYREFMDTENKIAEGTIRLESFDNSIELDDISFGYDTSSSVLQDISLSVKKGEKIGICGPSGGGKSTLIKLLSRQYYVDSGNIFIDNINIKDITRDSLMSKIGIVNQSNYIFNGSIKDNVTYGISGVTHVELVEACKKASIYKFIMGLDDKFETQVGNNGLKLSGGQKQRIALARIFLRNPDIILLDEATSALDNESEKVVQDSLNIFKDKTMITIAHRLSTIKNSDKIVVIDNHRIVEMGTHDKLMQKKDRYYDMYTTKKKEDEEDGND